MQGADPAISVKFCRNIFFVGEVCGIVSDVGPGSASEWQVKTTGTPFVTCATGTVTAGVSGTPTPGASIISFEYYSADDDDWYPWDGNPLPGDATEVRNVNANFTWAGTAYLYDWTSSGGTTYPCT